MRHRHRLSSARALALAMVAGGAALLGGGCATVTGLVTGPFTGAADLPLEVYRHKKREFDRTPLYWAPNVLVFAPLGLAAGPVLGLAKGIALDVQWLLGKMNYGQAFGTFRRPSIWRPFMPFWDPQSFP